jgi:uroporphyrinogen decarboxylase
LLMRTDWSKRNRLEAAIAGEPVDRPPVALWRHWPGDDQDAAALAQAHLQWQWEYDWDLIKVSPASSFCLLDWGVTDRWAGHPEGTREWTGRAIHDPADWERLPRLDPRQGMLGVQLEALRLVGEGLGDSAPFLATIFSPLAQAKNLAGGTRMISQMRSQPETFKRGMATITAVTLDYLEAAKKTGISGIYYAIQHAQYELLSPAEYEQWGRPYDLQILEAAGDLWLNMVHLHGADVFFEQTADYPVQITNWHDRECGVPLSQGLTWLAGAVSGGLSRETVQLGDPAAIQVEIGDALEQTGGQRLLLSTGCVIMTNSPQQNIRAVRAAVEPRH